MRDLSGVSQDIRAWHIACTSSGPRGTLMLQWLWTVGRPLCPHIERAGKAGRSACERQPEAEHP